MSNSLFRNNNKALDIDSANSNIKNVTFDNNRVALKVFSSTIKDSIFTNFQSFIADDPVSIHDLFNRWHGSYHPKSGNNLIIDDIRIDIGGSSTQWGYLGYTYRHQSFTQASNDLFF